MKYVKWIFVVLLIGFLTSFIDKNHPPSRGLNVGDSAPDFKIHLSSGTKTLDLSDLRGSYVLLSFWSSYDGSSRAHNVALNNAVQQFHSKVRFVSVSFDTSASIFEETVRRDKIDAPVCFVETGGKDSELYDDYHLDRGFSNYLLNDSGVIVAHNLSLVELSAYMNKLVIESQKTTDIFL